MSGRLLFFAPSRRWFGAGNFCYQAIALIDYRGRVWFSPARVFLGERLSEVRTNSLPLANFFLILMASLFRPEVNDREQEFAFDKLNTVQYTEHGSL
jgi:hypothetical protein